MSDYHCLVFFGFSPAKAAEIALDARRGCQYAIDIIRLSKPKEE